MTSFLSAVALISIVSDDLPCIDASMDAPGVNPSTRLVRCCQNSDVSFSAGSSITLHRRRIAIDGRTWTILSFRPSTEERFATNKAHDTWHVLTDIAGAQLLARVCWALAFDRRPRTVVVIDHRFLVSNPFDADPSMPVVFTNTDTTHVGAKQVVQIKRFLERMGPSEGRVKLLTSGLEDLIEGERPVAALFDSQQASGLRWNTAKQHVKCTQHNSLIVFSAAPAVLQQWASMLLELGRWMHRGTDSIYLDRTTVDAWPNGEVQILEDFDGERRQALQAREAMFPGQSHRTLLRDERADLLEALGWGYR